MTSRDQFYASLKTDKAPRLMSAAQTALWWIGKQNWQAAHHLVQAEEGRQDCDRIHALLHRQEGDLANARYWYARADARMPDQPIMQEWEELVRQTFSQTGTQPS